MRPKSSELARLQNSVLRCVAADYTSEYKIVLKLRTLEPPLPCFCVLITDCYERLSTEPSCYWLLQANSPAGAVVRNARRTETTSATASGEVSGSTNVVDASARTYSIQRLENSRECDT